jgi:type IV pilus assembly protein PilF
LNTTLPKKEGAFMTARVLPSITGWRIALLLVCGALAFTACSNSKTVKDQSQRGEAAAINLQIGIDYYKQGNLQLAKDKIERALEQDPHNATAHAAAGLLYDRLGEFAKAESHFSRAVALEPKNPELHNNFAVFLCRHEKYDRGEKQAMLAVADPLYKTPEVAYLNAAYCARGAADMKLAEQYFRRALAVRPRFAPALLEMADLEFKAKNYMSARAFLERYIAVQTPSAAALWLGIRIERVLGNRSTAGDYARRLMSDYPNAEETKAFLASGQETGQATK